MAVAAFQAVTAGEKDLKRNSALETVCVFKLKNLLT